jgi:hypothetical protein
MEIEKLVEDVQRIVQDEAYDAAWVVNAFNEALLLVATALRIPGLQDSSDVTALAGTGFVAMPDAYLHDLYLATTVTYPKGVIIVPNLKELIKNELSDQTGLVQYVSVDGSILSFRPMPTETETITLYYYAKPTTLLLGDSFPSYIPDSLQNMIFPSYALQSAYMQIEDGIDGRIPNTQKYSGLFSSALAALVAFYPNAPKGRVEIARAGSYY